MLVGNKYVHLPILYDPLGFSWGQRAISTLTGQTFILIDVSLPFSFLNTLNNIPRITSMPEV